MTKEAKKFKEFVKKSKRTESYRRRKLQDRINRLKRIVIRKPLKKVPLDYIDQKSKTKKRGFFSRIFGRKPQI